MKNIIAGLLLITMLPTSLQAQDYSLGKAAPLFQSHEIIHMKITTDLKTLTADVGDERDEHPATLEYYDEGKMVKVDIQVRTRGNFRRNSNNCSFPPMRINFKKKQVAGTLFDGIDKIKLVTHCRSKQKKYQQYVLREYMVYRAFNLITDTSYRVRLAFVTYEDVSSSEKPIESYAILIEPDDAFEKRFDAKQSDQKYLFPDSTSYYHMGNVAFFQYMIGNTDWAVSTQHNISLFTIDPDRPHYSIPYDFDWCGAVNTHYAVPLPRFGTQNVTDRIFRGQCRPIEELQQTAAFFNTKKEAIYELYSDFPLLTKREKRTTIHYFKSFYKTINDNRLLEYEILGNCLK